MARPTVIPSAFSVVDADWLASGLLVVASTIVYPSAPSLLGAGVLELELVKRVRVKPELGTMVRHDELTSVVFARFPVAPLLFVPFVYRLVFS